MSEERQAAKQPAIPRYEMRPDDYFNQYVEDPEGYWCMWPDVAAALSAARQQGAAEGTCDTCGLRGHGFQQARGGHYRKCMAHSLPCDDLGNSCGKWVQAGAAAPEEGRP